MTRMTEALSILGSAVLAMACAFARCLYVAFGIVFTSLPDDEDFNEFI